MRSLYRRKFCLDCSPFGSHNTSKQPLGNDPSSDATRKKRRSDSWYRYLKKRRLDRKRRLVEARGGRCEDCGYEVSIAALEFHHRDSKTKEFGVGNFNGSWKRLASEAEKCDLLCANCHRRRHGYKGLRSLEKKARAIALMGGACGGCGQIVPDSVLSFTTGTRARKALGSHVTA